MWRLLRISGVVALVASLPLSSGAQGAGHARSAASADALPTLTVGLTAHQDANFRMYVALRKHFFQKQGLAVKLVTGGPTIGTQVVAGQVDVGTGVLNTALSVARQGRATSVIIGAQGGATGGNLISNLETAPTLDRLKALSSCTVVSLPPGSTTYLWAELWIRELKLPCRHVIVGDQPSQLAGVIAGRFTAGTMNYPAFGPALTERKIALLMNTADLKVRQTYIRNRVMESAFWGMSDRLGEKRSLIVKFIKGLDEARKWAASRSDREVAATIRPLLKDRTVEQLTLGVRDARSHDLRGTTNGYITGPQWAATLDALKGSGISGFDSNDPEYAYAKRIDMSYYIAAVGKPRKG